MGRSYHTGLFGGDPVDGPRTLDLYFDRRNLLKYRFEADAMIRFFWKRLRTITVVPYFPEYPTYIMDVVTRVLPPKCARRYDFCDDKVVHTVDLELQRAIDELRNTVDGHVPVRVMTRDPCEMLRARLHLGFV
jgi:hypothetical protein